MKKLVAIGLLTAFVLGAFAVPATAGGRYRDRYNQSRSACYPSEYGVGRAERSAWRSHSSYAQGRYC